TLPGRSIEGNLKQIDGSLQSAWRDRAGAQAELLAMLPETTRWITGDQTSTAFLDKFCAQQHLAAAMLIVRGDPQPAIMCGKFPVPNAKPDEIVLYGRTIMYAGHAIGIAMVCSRLPINVVQKQREIANDTTQFEKLS